MAEELLVPLDDVADKVGRVAWSGRQVGLLGRLERQAVRHPGPPSAPPPSGPHRHYPGSPGFPSGHLDLVRPRERARTISQKKPDMAGICLALGRNLCTDYHFAALLHQAGGRMFSQENKFEVVFDSVETAEALGWFASCTSSRRRAPSNTASFKSSTRTDGTYGHELQSGRTLGRRPRSKAGGPGDVGIQPRG